MDASTEPFELLLELFSRQRLGVLATHGPEYPYASLVAVRADDDLDFHGAVAATAVGAARELAGDERAAQFAAFLTRHPHLRPFAGAPTSALVELEVDTYFIVSRFQNVTELHMR